MFTSDVKAYLDNSTNYCSSPGEYIIRTIVLGYLKGTNTHPNDHMGQNFAN